MTPFYSDDWLTLYGGDCREVLASLPADSVDCVVTSPPYWGLRDYGQDGQLGLERTPEEYVANMVAVFREVRRVLKPTGSVFLNLGDSYASSGSDARPYGTSGTEPEGSTDRGSTSPDLCDGCRGALRLHTARTDDQPAPTPAGDSLDPTQAHTGSASDHPASGDSSHPTQIHRSDAATQDQRPSLDPAAEQPRASRESKRRRSSQPLPAECSHCDRCGACLSVLRSSSRDAQACARRSGSTHDSGRPASAYRSSDKGASDAAYPHSTIASPKPKDLVGIPWRVAFALQADGWYLRSDIIWSKPNPMPESVTDRPTKSHEYLFLLTKSARYYFDADAVREPQRTDEATFYAKLIKQPHKGQRGKDEVNDRHNTAGFQDAIYNPAGRNIRSVWSIATRPYPGAHFAVFPPELPERCIKAGSSERGVCPHTGEPWERVVEGERVPVGHGGRAKTGNRDSSRGDHGTGTMYAMVGRTTGWQPTCDHDAEPVPAVILDPFGGSGTVGMVANRLSRRAILIDLNPAYLQQQLTRNAQTPLGLTEGDAA